MFGDKALHDVSEFQKNRPRNNTSKNAKLMKSALHKPHDLNLTGAGHSRRQVPVVKPAPSDVQNSAKKPKKTYLRRTAIQKQHTWPTDGNDNFRVETAITTGKRKDLCVIPRDFEILSVLGGALSTHNSRDSVEEICRRDSLYSTSRQRLVEMQDRKKSRETVSQSGDSSPINIFEKPKHGSLGRSKLQEEWEKSFVGSTSAVIPNSSSSEHSGREMEGLIKKFRQTLPTAAALTQHVTDCTEDELFGLSSGVTMQELEKSSYKP